MGSAGTILVVDDDHGVREALETALSTRYQVHTAATASAALDALAAHQFDLILLDYRLPDLLGTSVLQTIKRFFPSTAVILMTGFGTEDVAVQALRGGARDYIRKPVDFREYLARRRIAKAKELLRDTSRTVTDVFREVGFKDMTHFGRVFKKLEGTLPSEFRRGREAGSPRAASQVGEKNPSI